MERDYRQNFQRGERGGGRGYKLPKTFNQRGGYFLEQRRELQPCS